MSNYDASSIKILDGVELADIPYMKIEATAKRYAKPIEVVLAAYEACNLVGLSFDDYYINKYCKGNKTIPYSPEFQDAYQECRNTVVTNTTSSPPSE